MKIIISIIPILAYIIILIWTNSRINSIISNKSDRKRYKAYFNKMLGEFLSPVFLLSAVLLMIFFSKPEKYIILGITFIVLKIMTLALSGLNSFYIFRNIKPEFIKLLNRCDSETLLKNRKGNPI